MLEVLIELLKMRARWWRVDGEGKVEGGRGRRVRVEGREGGGEGGMWRVGGWGEGAPGHVSDTPWEGGREGGGGVAGRVNGPAQARIRRFF